jgi:PAS domain S-box-containing protein
LPESELLQRVSQLSPDTIVLITNVFRDQFGRPYIPVEVVKQVAAASAAPVYSALPGWFGTGVVGGRMGSWERQGEATADLLVRILDGADPRTLPRLTPPMDRDRVDARALVRWGLSEGAASGAEISFRQPGVWDQYRTLVLATLAVFVLQSAFVFALLIQRRRRQRAEDLLKESEERMTFTAASVNVGLWQFDRKTGQLWATEHCRALFGLNNDVPLTRDTLLSAVHPQDRAAAVTSLRKIWEEQRSADGDVRVVLPDGQIRWVSVRARVHPDGRGSDSHITGIFVDVTEQKAAEAESALQREEVAHLMRVSVLGELSGAMAHEINQPLAAVQSNAETGLDLLSARTPDLIEIRGVLEDIAHDNRRASEVIRRLHALLKKGEKKSEIVDLNELAKSTVALLRTEAINRRANVDLDLAKMPPAVQGDPIQLQQVLLNLVMNALDAIAMVPPERRLVTVSTQPSQNGKVEFIVKDHGAGISPGDQARLFEPFYTTKVRGLGLGLTICSTIIDTHGGQLTITNDPAGGAVARVSLPAREMLAAAE